MPKPAPADPLPPEASAGPVVFFDGVCGLCNRYVDFVLKRDKSERFRFASLQGAFAKEAVPSLDQSRPPESMLLLKDGRLYDRSTAALLVLAELPAPTRWLGLLLWIPRPLRNVGYRLIAKYRYRWFGQNEACRTPTPEQRARFLM